MTERGRRGLGAAELLLRRKTGTVRVLMRLEKTMDTVACFYVACVAVYYELKTNAYSVKSWVWDRRRTEGNTARVEVCSAEKFGDAPPELVKQLNKAASLIALREMGAFFAKSEHGRTCVILQIFRV